MARTRIPVAARFVIGYLLLASALSALIIHHLVGDDEEHLLLESSKKGEAIARLFARSLVNPLYQLDVDMMENAISHAQGLEDVGAVTIFDDQGRVVTDGTAPNPRLGDVLPAALELVKAHQKRTVVVQAPEHLTFSQLVTLGDKVLGGVQMDLSLKSAHARVAHVMGELIMLAAGLTLLGALPVWLISHFLIKPLVFGDS